MYGRYARSECCRPRIINLHPEADAKRAQLAAEKERKEAERKAAEEAEAARRAKDDREDREAAAARVAQAQERRASAAKSALSRCETEFGVAWACEPAVRAIPSDCIDLSPTSAGQ